MKPAATNFYVPKLCNAAPIALLVLCSELLVLVLMLAAGPVTWIRFALMSLFVLWIVIPSAGLLCLARPWLMERSLAVGSACAMMIVLTMTLLAGVVASWVLGRSWAESGEAFALNQIDWMMLGRQIVIAAIIAGLALRYFYVQRQLRLQEQAELQSRIQALQSRIRPHFLFNSMNIIASLIETDPETAEIVVEDLSELFRASLNEAGNQVALAEELALCERYVRIEKLRLGDRLRVDWQLDLPDEDVRIPLLTLQPLLENAIYHGIQPLPDGGLIVVAVWSGEGRVHMRITNPLPEAGAKQSEGNRMALANIRSRLDVLYGSAARLSAEATSGSYETYLSYPMTSAVASG